MARTVGWVPKKEMCIRDSRWITEAGLDCDIEVDGGIGSATIAGAASAGANVLVAGSALYRDPEGLAHAVSELRATATAAATT